MLIPYLIFTEILLPRLISQKDWPRSPPTAENLGTNTNFTGKRAPSLKLNNRQFHVNSQILNLNRFVFKLRPTLKVVRNHYCTLNTCYSAVTTHVCRSSVDKLSR